MERRGNCCSGGGDCTVSPRRAQASQEGWVRPVGDSQPRHLGHPLLSNSGSNSEGQTAASGRQRREAQRASEARARRRDRARELPTGRSARGLAHAASGPAFVAGHEIRPGLRLNQAEGRAGNFPVQLAARRLHNRTRRAPPSLQVRSRARWQIGAAPSAWGAAGSSPSRSVVPRGERAQANHLLAPINFAWPSAYSLPCKPGPLPGTPRRFFRPLSQPALGFGGSFGQRVCADPGALACIPLAAHEGCSPSPGSAGS